MIECALCNTKFKDRRGFGLHLSTTHKTYFDTDTEKEKFLVYTLFGKDSVDIAVQEYVSELYCINNMPIDIAKYISLLGIKRTSKEERKTKRYKDTYLLAIQTKYGDDIKNISQVKSVQKQKEATIIKNYGSYETYLINNRERMKVAYADYALDDARIAATRSKVIATNIVRYGVDNPAKSLPIRTIMGNSQRLLCSLLLEDELRERTLAARAAVCSHGGYSSKPEKRIRKVFVELDLDIECNKNLWHYNWDIIFDRYLVEVQGTMWHAKPGKYKETDLIMGKLLAKDIWEKDRKKHIKAVSEGYTVIEIWEDEIAKCNDTELTQLVTERLIKNGYKF